MRIGSRISVLAFITAASLAACGGGGGSVTPPASGGGGNPSPSPTATQSAAPTFAPTVAPTIAPTPTPMPTQHPTPTPTPMQTAAPQVIHIGFELAEHTDAQFGPVYFYSTVLNGMASVVRVPHGSKVVFLNDDPNNTQHTASGFGSAGFPASFDNTSGFNQHGTTIDGSTSWSTGTLNPGQMSQVFTVGAAGTYYFGCAFHYFTVPTANNGSMGDVIVSM